MLQVIQSLRDGRTEVVDVPTPACATNAIVVRATASVISAGTERMLVEFGKAGLIAKARSQPDKVRQAIQKIATDGLHTTVEAVRAKLDAPIPLGYCSAGVVAEVGSGVVGIRPGNRVVTNGPHAEIVSAPQTLAAVIPPGVSDEAAAFTPLAAIGLQGVRLAAPTLGETVVVYGLGLVGLLTLQMVSANGCRAIGIDISADRCALANELGAEVVQSRDPATVSNAVLELTSGIGADAVLLTLATDSDDPMHAAALMSRKRGRIVLVGVSGLNLRRDDFYKKEISFQVSCSYGPGRYDARHEGGGIDYPLPYVRWTEGRNFNAVLGLMAAGKLQAERLITHRFDIQDAPRAYDAVQGDPSSLGVVLRYPVPPSALPIQQSPRTVRLAASQSGAIGAGISVIGAGNYASRFLIPNLKRAGAHLRLLASHGGLSAAIVGRRHGFDAATTHVDEVFADSETAAVIVATPHDSHAALAVRALEAGKDVFVEKPLGLTHEQVDRIEATALRSRGRLCVGFNRRFAPMVQGLRRALEQRSGPVAIVITVNAGSIGGDHWIQDAAAGGGRILGEGCHFIDLARFLADSPIAAVQVVAAPSHANQLPDTATLQLRFSDGAIATVQYLSNGSRAYPKERVEAFFDHKAVRIDNYRRIQAWGISDLSTRFPRMQDKGQGQLAARFLEAVRDRAPMPIPMGEIVEVSRVSIDASWLAASGSGAKEYAT